MFGQLFGKYLVKENILDEETLNKILSARLQIRVKLGVIAVADKLLTTEQADEINRIQQQEDKRFGDIAIEKGWLTDAQISELLEKQGNPYMQFLQVLVENSSIKISKIDGYIDDFQKELGLNDEQMAALKKDDVDGVVGAFTKDAQGYAAKIASLVLRNITRFVSNNYYIENTVITFEETPLSAEAWTDRIRRIRDSYPFLVAEEDGVIVGYAYLDSYNSRSAYRYTADLSIYLDPAVRTRGIGFRLLQAIEQEAVQRGFKSLISIITEGNLPSLRFHEKNGFLFRGRLERVGLKFGRWLDVAFYQKSL